MVKGYTDTEREEIRSTIGDRPVYVTLDIDCVDPAFAPGTGTPEVASDDCGQGAFGVGRKEAGQGAAKASRGLEGNRVTAA